VVEGAGFVVRVSVQGVGFGCRAEEKSRYTWVVYIRMLVLPL